MHVQEEQRDDSMPMTITPRMPHAGSELSEQQASTEMAFRLNNARQTVDFVRRQVGAMAITASVCCTVSRPASLAFIAHIACLNCKQFTRSVFW